MAVGNGRKLQYLIFSFLFLFCLLVTDAAPSSTNTKTSPDISGNISPPNTTTSRPNTTTAPTTSPPNPPALLNEVIVGVKVLQRRMKVHLAELGSLYRVNSATQESGLQAFSVLSQSLMTINLLERNDIASDSLSIYKLVVKGILDDACHWFASHMKSTVDCNNPSSIAVLFLTFGLRPHVGNLSTFVKSLPHLDSRQEANSWITRTFQNTDNTLQCQLCRSLNLRNCCPDQ